MINRHFFLLPDGILQHRPLPDLPSSADDVGGGIRDPISGSLGSGFSLLDGSMRWTSRENLLTAANDEDPQLFVALYDFQAGGENQLSLKKAEQVGTGVHVRGFHQTISNESYWGFFCFLNIFSVALRHSSST
jgi:hypothetical protein